MAIPRSDIARGQVPSSTGQQPLNADTFNAPAKALQGLGHEAMQFSHKMEVEEAKISTAKSRAEATEKAHDLETRLQTSHGTDPNYRKMLTDGLNDIYKSYIDAAPNKIARNHLQAVFATEQGQFMVRAGNYEKQARLGEASIGIKSTLDTLQNTVSSHPEQYQSARAQGLSLINNNEVLDANQKAKIALSFSQGILASSLSGRIKTDAKGAEQALLNGDFDADLEPRQKEALLSEAKQTLNGLHRDNNARFDYLIAEGTPYQQVRDGLENALKQDLITVPDFYKRMNQLQHREQMIKQKANSNARIDEKIRLGLARQVDETPQDLNDWYKSNLEQSGNYSIENKTSLVANLNAPATSFTAEMDFALKHAPVIKGAEWGQAFKTLDNNKSAALDKLDGESKAIGRDAVFFHDQQHYSWEESLQLARDARNPLNENERKHREAQFDALSEWSLDKKDEAKFNQTIANIIGATKWWGLRHDADKIPDGEKRTIRNAAQALFVNGRISPEMLLNQMQKEYSRNYGVGYFGQFMKWPQSKFDPDLSQAAINNSLFKAVYDLADRSQANSGAYAKYHKPDKAAKLDYADPNFSLIDHTKGEKPKLYVDGYWAPIDIVSDSLTPEGYQGRPSYRASYFDQNGRFHFVIDPDTGLPWRYVPDGYDKIVAPYLKLPKGLPRLKTEDAQKQLKALREGALNE